MRYLYSGLLALFFLGALPADVQADAENSAGSYFTSQEKAWLDGHPEVSIIYAENTPPVLFTAENGQQTGILMDYAQLLSAETGIRFRIVSRPSWQEALADAKNRTADILGPNTAQPQFARHYHFTLPVVSSKTYIFGPTYSPVLASDLSGLSGKRVGYIRSIHAFDNFAREHTDIRFRSYQTVQDLITALEYGDIDFIMHFDWFEYQLRVSGISTFKIHLNIRDLDVDFFLGVRNDWPELTRIINKVFIFNKEKTRAIRKHWFEYTRSIKVTGYEVQLTEAEQNWLQQHPVIRVGLNPLWAPIEFLDDNGTPQGISIQYLQRLESLLGIRFEFVTSLSWSDAYRKLSGAELDLLPAISSTSERQQQANFTAPYLSIPIGIFSAVDKAYLGDLDALAGKRVVVVEGYAIQSWLQQEHPEIDLLTAPTLKAALQKVARGDAYAFVGNLISASYYIGQSSLNQIKVVGETEYRNDLSMAVRQDWPLLPGILQKAINAIPQSERTAIYNDWISIQYTHSVDYTILWKWLAGATIIILLIAYWNHRLTKEIAQRRSIERALRAAKQQAEQASQEAKQANQAKSRFLASMSHEIRTPMNAVISAGYLLRQTDLNNQQQTYLEKMACAADALLGLINDVLDFSKGEATRLELDVTSFRLRDILDKIHQTFTPLAIKKGLQLTLQIAPEIPDVLIGDAGKLSQILRNLTDNALKFTSQGEVNILLELQQFTDDGRKAQIQFSVADTGPGMSPAVQKQLFQPFSQGDASITRNHGGTGLGLAISEQLAQLMGSHITVRSQPEKGSTFTFSVTFEIAEPQSDHNSAPLYTASSQLQGQIKFHPELTGVKVLMVEDDEMNQFFGSELIMSLGVEVDIADSGERALQLLQQQTFDLLFMDVSMPGMDGYETTRRIRADQRFVDLPIIALTAHAQPQERNKCLAAGMNDHQSKPFDPEQLENMILKWTRHR